MVAASSIEATVIGWLRSLFGSRTFEVVTIGLVLASIGAVFGVASSNWYGTDHGVNLLGYWHIALAWGGALALSITFVGSLLYLYRGRDFFEYLAHASGEIGFLYVSLTLITGSIWGRVIWNTWWDWGDIRLVTFLIVWFVYAGYLIIRAGARQSPKLRRYAAVYGVVGFITIPVSYFSTRLFAARLHAPTTGNGGAEADITLSALFVTLIALTLLYVYLMGSRVRLHELSSTVDHHKERLDK